MAKQLPANWGHERKRRFRLIDRASSWADRHKGQLKNPLWRAYVNAEAQALQGGDNPSKSLVDAQERALQALPA